tara:strand:+ start:830 stop:1027 length:198 start_codon:yes stop_codon:yes gene_type:complete
MNQEERKLNIKVIRLEKEISELKVLIDTLQTNLRSAVSQLDEDKKDSIVNVQSYKWCVNWRPSSS